VAILSSVIERRKLRAARCRLLATVTAAICTLAAIKINRVLTAGGLEDDGAAMAFL